MASLSPYIYFHLSRYKMVKIHLALPYEKRLLPFLLEPLGPPDELWMMGQGGDCATVHPQLASTLLKNVKETSSITVPDAPVIALKELAQLLHLGRYNLCLMCNIR